MLWKLRLAAGLALGMGLLAPQGALSAGSGSFSPTGPMATARNGAAAALLPDGRVLVAGGYNGASISSAEVFNPATNAFTAANSMGTARDGPAVAPLPGGRVLIAGGNSDPPYLMSAEVFNSATGTFGSAGIGSMGTGRSGAAAAALPDGRVLVAGGANPGGSLSSAEVFNPATNTFTPVSDMGTARRAPAAAPLPDGRVLVAGGYDSGSGRFLSSAEVFDPNTGTFSSVGIGAMAIALEGAAAAALPDGRVLVAGGYYYDGANHYVSSAELFNPTTGSFSSAGIGAMGIAREDAAAAPLPDGRVLVAGGFNGAFLSSAEVFAATNAFGFAIKGKRLIVSVQASGKVSVSDARAPLSAAGAKKKRKVLLTSSSASGDPPTITVALRLSKLAKQRLRQKGKVTVKARITFTPRGGLANTRSAKLKIKGKKRK